MTVLQNSSMKSGACGIQRLLVGDAVTVACKRLLLQAGTEERGEKERTERGQSRSGSSRSRHSRLVCSTVR